jgi:hypothetical protein
MKTFILTFNVLTSCKTAYFTGKNNNNIDFNSAIDTLFQDKISIRAIVIDANKIWYAADKGRFGFIIWIIINLKAVLKDSLKLEFRSNAQTKKYLHTKCWKSSFVISDL